jgi:hypothetical protein
VTGSRRTQFDELSEPYYFGLALFDNAQVLRRPETLIGI